MVVIPAIVNAHCQSGTRSRDHRRMAGYIIKRPTGAPIAIAHGCATPSRCRSADDPRTTPTAMIAKIRWSA